MKLDFLFDPKSIAIVGVSSDPKKLGAVILTNLISSGYKGSIYPINPNHNEIYGKKCYSSLLNVADDIELVCIVVPNKSVNSVLIDAGKKGVKGAVIISAGFSESNENGAILEKDILKTAKKYNIRLMGPNCLGQIITKSKINLSFAASNAIEGDIAFLSQSGAFLTAMLDMSLQKNLGFSHLVSIGNKSDLNENDFIQNWLQDSDVNILGAYLEDIQAGRDLVNIYNKSSIKKPFVIFKPGETEESQNAISSHTGSLAGSFEVYNAAMRQAGIAIAKDIDDMFNFLMGFSWSKIPEGNKVAIITNAGGPGVIMTDFLINNGLELAEISKETQESIAKDLPFNASTANPIDVIGDADAERYRIALDVLIKEPTVDSIFVVLTPQIVTEIENTAKVVINAYKMSNKPIIPIFIGGKYVSFGLQKLFDEKIPAFSDLSQAVDMLAALYRYKQKSKNRLIHRFSIDRYLSRGKYKNEIHRLLKQEGEEVALPESLVEKLAEEVQIELPNQIITNDIEEAIVFLQNNKKVVIKATTDVIAHKTERKALYLNISDEVTLKNNFSELQDMIKQEFNIDDSKILVQEQVEAEEEIFIGANRDGDSNVYEPNSNGFGHLLAFGKGGIYTEVYKDIGYSLVPSNRAEILKSLKSTKIFQVIDGARGKEKLALENLLDLIEKVQKLVLLYPEIESLDINPVLLTTKRSITVDLKIFIKR